LGEREIDLVVFSKKTLPLHHHHTPKRLVENAAAHLGCARTPVAKDDGHFNKLKSEFPGNNLRLYFKIATA